MDEVDIASQREAEHKEDCMKSITDLVPDEKPYMLEQDIIECEECGVVIPYERARRGYIYCVSCVEYQEKLNKSYNRRSIRNYEDE